MTGLIGQDADRKADLDKTAYAYFSNPDERNLLDVVKNGRRLINYFIKIYGCKYSREDLNQVGIEGILKALRRYNPDSGVSFSTFAGHCIIGEIRHYMRKEISYLRPRVIEKLEDDIEATIKREWNKTGIFPEVTSLSKKLNIREEGIRTVMQSWLVPLEELDLSKIESQRYESFRLPIEDKLALEQALNKLSDLQKKVIRMLFYHDMTQQQAAVKLQINQRKVSRLMHSSLDILRTEL